MTLWRLYSLTRIAAAQNNWRIGQALFNTLVDVRADISEKLRASKQDPFYSDSALDARYQAAIKYIEAHWFDAPYYAQMNEQRTGEQPV